MRLKVISLSELNNLLKDCGFSNTVQKIDLELILQSNDYFYVQGIFNADWRKGDSIWSLVTDEILSKVLKKADKFNTDGGLEAYMRQHDQKREKSDQVIFSISKK